MRDFKGMKRQRSRNRGGGGSNGGKPQHNANRAFDSNGPEGVKVRGAAQHVYEKYQQLARDAGSAGDRVLAENYLQHSEHYFRTVRAMQPTRPVTEIMGSRDQFVSNYDMDYEEEHPQVEAVEAPEAEVVQSEGGPDGRNDNQNRGYERQRDDRQRDDRPRDEYRQRDDRPRDEYRQRDDRPRDDRPRDDRPNGQRDDRPREDYRQRDDRPRDDRPRDDRPRDDRPRDERPREEFRQREDRPRGDRQRDDRNGNREDRPNRFRDDRPPRQDRPDRDPLAVVEPQSQPLTAAPVAREEAPSRFLRGQDGAASEAPAFLQSRPAAPAAPEEEKKPRRRRAPKSFEGGDAPAAVEADEG